MALPTDKFLETVDRNNNSFALVNVCSCRHEADLLGKRVRQAEGRLLGHGAAGGHDR